MLYTEYSKISISTSCMDRNDMLIQTLPTWLLHPVKEIIIVDWSSKKPIVETLKENNVNYPRAKDSWASDFIESSPSYRQTTTPSVCSVVPTEIILSPSFRIFLAAFKSLS